MSRRSRDPRPRRRGLSKDDLAVWEHVAKGVTPITGRASEAAPRPLSGDRPEIDDLERAFRARLAKTQGTSEDRAVGRVAIATKQRGQATTEAMRPSQGALAENLGSRRQVRRSRDRSDADPGGLDQKLTRKIRRGQVDIDDTIDLHGMTQATAHAALRRFIVRCAAQNRRTVLVITGKGEAARGDGEDAWWAERSRNAGGILKRSLPDWLSDPGLRPLVLGYETAAPHHGGQGAFYIRLKRRR
ncbi:MAG: Smr/MutS family protein [Pseudomonadota bacterium]